MESEFRSHIAMFLSRTGYVKHDYSESRLREIAEALGVTYSTFMEARRIHQKRLVRLGQAKNRFEDYHARRNEVGNLKNPTGVCLHCPTDIKAELQRYAAGRGTTIATLFRSVVHQYLQGSWEPQLYDHWRLPNLVSVLQPRGAVCHPRISAAARRAMWMRAELRSSCVEQLGRSLLIETVNGNFGRPGELVYITGRQMFSDVFRYKVRFEEDPVDIPKTLDFAAHELREGQFE